MVVFFLRSWMESNKKIDTNITFLNLEDKSISCTSYASFCFLGLFLCFLQLQHLRILKNLITKQLLLFWLIWICVTFSVQTAVHIKRIVAQQDTRGKKSVFGHFLSHFFSSHQLSHFHRGTLTSILHSSWHIHQSSIEIEHIVTYVWQYGETVLNENMYIK